MSTEHTIVLRIPGTPTPQPRAKATTFGGRTRIYTPMTRKGQDGKRRSNGVAEFKALAKLVAANTFGDGAPLTGPVRVDCEFVFPRPLNMIWKRKPMVRVPKTTKPDRDNLDKMILDALTGVVFRDDNQVWDGTITKLIGAGDEQPHTLVTVTQTAVDKIQETRCVNEQQLR